ncbi:bile acid:sodium symporter family protein [Mesorhizobium sp. LjRoot246]|uniref:bile acid:sodium symporter family protein n=1 Tax=Mesorhizobium sp. LjRoot246 TaxID=3342294 RepID=UPI003ECFB497
MTLADVIPMAINLSMALMVLALGLHASWSDATSLLRQPVLLARSFISMNVVMTVLAVLMALSFNLHPAVKLALVALALSPVPPILPGKQTKAGGSTSYVVGLLVTISVLSIVVVPLGIGAISGWFDLGIGVPAARIASVVLMSVVAPLVIGLLIRQFAPAFASRLARPLSTFATILLIAAFIPVLIKIWPALMAMIGNRTLLALAIFTLIGVAVGHVLGGPEPDNRTVLALASGTRHPGVAMAIASITFPDEKAVIAVVLWHLIVGAVVCIPYVNWRKRAHAAMQSKTAL